MSLLVYLLLPAIFAFPICGILLGFLHVFDIGPDFDRRITLCWKILLGMGLTFYPIIIAMALL